MVVFLLPVIELQIQRRAFPLKDDAILIAWYKEPHSTKTHFLPSQCCQEKRLNIPS